MSKKQFKSESKRLLDMMIHSIYTNSDIFLRELISNASDALDKRYYLALTNNAAIDRSTLKITLTPNKENRTFTISDNGIGMDEKELEQAVKKLLVEACSSRRVLEPGIDLLESGLLDSLGLITLLDGLEDMGIEIQPTQVDRSCFRSVEGILQLCRSAKESPEAT